MSLGSSIQKTIKINCRSGWILTTISDNCLIPVKLSPEYQRTLYKRVIRPIVSIVNNTALTDQKLNLIATMYLSSLNPALLLGVVSQLVLSSPTIARRQDVAGLQLLEPNSSCTDFSLKGSTISSECLLITAGLPVPSSVDLNLCVTNAGGQLIYLVK